MSILEKRHKGKIENEQNYISNQNHQSNSKKIISLLCPCNKKNVLNKNLVVSNKNFPEIIENKKNPIFRERIIKHPKIKYKIVKSNNIRNLNHQYLEINMIKTRNENNNQQYEIDSNKNYDNNENNNYYQQSTKIDKAHYKFAKSLRNYDDFIYEIKTNNNLNQTEKTKTKNSEFLKPKNYNNKIQNYKIEEKKNDLNTYQKKCIPKSKFTKNLTNNFKKNRQNTIIKKFIDLQKVDNYKLNLPKENKVKFFSKLKQENTKSFIIKEKEKKNIHDIVKYIISIIEEYDLPEEEIKTIIKILNSKIKPSKYQIKLIEQFKISCQKINKKNYYNEIKQSEFDNTKTKKNKIEENEQKNGYDEITNKKEKQINKNENKSLIYQKMYGFRNEGNNCYLNSSLQLLTRIIELKEEIFNFNEVYTDNDTKGELLIEFRNLLQKIENSKDKNLILNPRKLKSIMGNVDDKYKSNFQEDSNEFITNFINALLSETGNKEKKVQKLNIIKESDKRPYENLYKKFFQRKGYSFIFNLFYGILKVTKICKNCKVNSIKFNAYNILELQLYNLTKKNRKKDLNLKDLLNNFSEETKCEEVCDNCSTEEVYSKTTIYTLPKYLIISFGRICEGNYYSNYINYPKLLDIKCEFEIKESSYLLNCVIEHSGGLSSGHYTSLIPIDKKHDNWARFSDEYYNGNTGFESRNAIILLYKNI